MNTGRLIGKNGVDYDEVYRRVMCIAQRLEITYQESLARFGRRVEAKMIAALEREVR